ncbi:rho GTPase-activating protein 44-like isoform X2 [Leptonychotes weddellii]|uniref:Rho GTPase-activating protein 44-like isoform X2 n=1 Tax=Leptonychotes weddellii TaxID=9713 RepID=A0A7F8QAP0_LEPWE|nr:rho GTPase-activating protein 44-like isoform X2 [Leptonychotes weddellii]
MLVGSWQTEGRGVERALSPGVWRSERNAGPQSPRRDSHLSRSISEGRGADQELAQRSTWDCDPQAGAALASRSSGALTRLVCFCSSTSKSKELSPGSGQKGSAGSSQGTPGAGTQPGAQAGASPSQPPPDQSPHTLRKVSKKLAPIPPKVPFGQPGAMTDQSAGQPSPLSLSPTPPSTPSPYGLSYPQGYSLASGQLSPAAAAAPPLTSPAGFPSTAAKSRPTPKPRQRPTLPPPQPPTVSLPAPSPQSTEHPVLDGMAPGESMSTAV